MSGNVGAAVRSIPASRGASCGKVPWVGWVAVITTPRAPNCGSPATSATSSTGATQVSAPARSSTHSSRGRVAKARAKAARISGWAVSS